MNLHAAIELFLGNYRPSTRRSYMYVLRNFESYIGPARPLSDIQAVDIIRYSQYLSQRPEIKSPVSYNKYVKTLRTFLTGAFPCSGFLAAPCWRSNARKLPIASPVIKPSPMMPSNNCLITPAGNHAKMLSSASLLILAVVLVELPPCVWRILILKIARHS